jgi:hypothetical protein
LVTPVLATFTASPRAAAMLLVTALLGVVAVYILRQRQDETFLWHGYVMVSAYLLFLPTSFHPWYLIWILPFLCLYPSWGWLYLSGAIMLSYLKYIQVSPDVPFGIRLLEFIPLYMLLAIEAVRHRWLHPGPSETTTLMMEKSP